MRKSFGDRAKALFLYLASYWCLFFAMAVIDSEAIESPVGILVLLGFAFVTSHHFFFDGKHSQRKGRDDDEGSSNG